MPASVLVKYLKKYLFWIILSVLLSTVHNYLNLLLPKLLSYLVDVIVKEEQWTLLWSGELKPVFFFIGYFGLFGELVAIFLITGILALFITLIAQYIGTNVVYNIRSDMFRSLQAQSYRFFDKNRTGDLMSKTTHDVNVTRDFLAQQIVALIRNTLTLIIILYNVFTINWKLSLIFLSLVPILAWMMRWYRKHMYPTYLKMANKNGILTSVLQENVVGVRVVKAFARTQFEMKKFKEANDDFVDSNMDVIKLSTLYGPLQEFVTQMGAILLLFVGALLAIQGDMTEGAVIAFFVYFEFLYEPIRGLINIFSHYSHVEASMVRINSILENKSEIVENVNPIVMPQIKGKVVFEDVWFSYESDEHYALQELSFTVEPGERLAILGATGSGKSTLINLIPRFYDPTKGRILIDGKELKELKIDEYRHQVGMVSQDIFLFSRSIRDNIAYGVRGKITQEEIERVGKVAAIHNFVIGLPEGYKTIVGERGQTLSGGQKQRVAIARALLLDPRILILDDSLSAVDIDTEAQIQRALDTLFKERTTFVITQRISTVQNCDRILVLDDGKIVELGTHDDLYAQNGIYTRIYNTMFKAQTRAEDRRKQQLKALATTESKFKQLPPLDARTLETLYQETYIDDKQRAKAEEKAAQRIEKVQTQDQKQEKELEKRLLKEEQKIEKQFEKELAKLEKEAVKKIEKKEKEQDKPKIEEKGSSESGSEQNKANSDTNDTNSSASSEDPK